MTIETNKEIPILFACLVLIHMSDDKICTQNAEWLMCCALYFMKSRKEYISEFINVTLMYIITSIVPNL